MKMNKSKIIVSTLALAMGAALAGSVSGTVAWFQYSTRAQASYIGATAHCSEALEMTKGNVTTSSVWGNELDSAAITGSDVKDIVPITNGKLEANSPLNTVGGTGADANDIVFYRNPIYQIPEYAKWGKATTANYVQFDLHFHVKDINGENTVSYLKKDLYLVDLTIKAKQNGESAELDLYKAIRVHFSAVDPSATSATPTNNLFARDDDKASSATISTAVSGKLDLNNDGAFDLEQGYEWDFGTGENARKEVVYGDKDQVQVAKNVATTVENKGLADDTDPYDLKENEGKLGEIKAAEDGLKLTVTIWLEGWQELSAMPAMPSTSVTDAAQDKAVWDPATYINKNFQVGMRFAIKGHDNAVDHA